MSQKYDVDPTTQGTMIPSSAASVALGRIVEVEEGVFFQEPLRTDVAQSPFERLSIEEQEEITRSRSEASAIDSLSRAAKTRARITNMEKGLWKLEEGAMDDDEDDIEIARLHAAIATSKNNLSGFRVQAKLAFSKSVGIASEVVPVERIVEGRPKKVNVVQAIEPVNREELENSYATFYSEYGDYNKQLARDMRANQIEAAVEAKLNG